MPEPRPKRDSQKETPGSQANERYLIGLKHQLSSLIERSLNLEFNAVQIEIVVPPNRHIDQGLVLPSDSVIHIHFVSGDPAVPTRIMRVRRTIGRNNGWTIENGDGEISPQEQAAVLDALNRLRA